MSTFKQYRKTAVTEMAPWSPDVDAASFTATGDQVAAGSPKVGDMIARDPAHPSDRWLITADYFAANYAPVETP